MNTVYTHICACGNEIMTQGWNNNVNTILRCQECENRRQSLLIAINADLTPESETVYIANTLRDLISVSDFTSVEVIYRRPEKMNGQDFQIA